MKLISACFLVVILVALSEASNLDFSNAHTGCFQHTRAHPVLSAANSNKLSLLTLEICYEFCKKRHFNMFGLQGGENCYCGNAVLTKNRLPNSSTCNLPCVGFQSGTCGGVQSMDVFALARVRVKSKIVKAPSPLPPYSVSLGCYKYDRSVPVLQATHFIPSTLDRLACYKVCNSKHFNFFGLFNGNSCFCGTHIRKYKAEKDCSTVCPANSQETCGGPKGVETYEIVKP